MLLRLCLRDLLAYHVICLHRDEKFFRQCELVASRMLSWSRAVVAVAIVAAAKCFLPSTVFLTLAVVAFYYRKNISIIYKTFWRDFSSFKLLRTTYKFLKDCERKNQTMIDLFRKQLEKSPKKPVIYFENQIWTFSDMEDFSNRIANAFLTAGYEKGDVIALLMGNCPEYIGIWFGISKIGGVTALINTNLRNKPLVHCLDTANVKAIVYSEEYESAIEEISKGIENLKKFRWGGERGVGRHLNALVEEASSAPPAVKAQIGYRDKALYVYTSGTTGLPKAAIIPHHRLLVMSMAVSCIMRVNENDIVYNPLPLFHTAGGLLGIAGALTHGFASVIRKKFSASAFWPDCVKYNCTVAQYIGEMCRYVMMVPPKPEDTQHKVRFIFGNGMRTSLWEGFRDRFRLERISEIYGSTEGNTNLVNLDKTVGAVGFLPRIIPDSMIPMALIKVDEFGDPIRNSKGFCIRCGPNEPGMFIGMIASSDATREYSGYVGDKKESEKKVVQNVFTKGDRAFLSGDILVMDELGYLYFKDRTGDTFRWKGENVSTAEVEGIISSAVGLRDVLVYGVKVGNLEGRAGMATVVDPELKVDLQTLASHLEKNLPPYARPLFLRLTDHVDLTGTFKLKKLNFQKEGFDPKTVKDKLYFKSGNAGYVELTEQMYDDIISGAIRV